MKKSKACNHIVGISNPRFGEKKPIYHDEFIKRKGRWRGHLHWRCPLCHVQIWKWVDKYTDKLGHHKIRRYVGHGKRIDF